VPIVVCLLLFLFSKCDRSFGLDRTKIADNRIEDWEGKLAAQGDAALRRHVLLLGADRQGRLSGSIGSPVAAGSRRCCCRAPCADGSIPTAAWSTSSLGYELAQHPDIISRSAAGFSVEVLAPAILFVRNIWLRLYFVAGATVFHQANWFLMNVQFYFYPFVFVTFFNMAA
jgi:hypothetical protein